MVVTAETFSSLCALQFAALEQLPGLTITALGAVLYAVLKVMIVSQVSLGVPVPALIVKEPAKSVEPAATLAE